MRPWKDRAARVVHDREQERVVDVEHLLLFGRAPHGSRLPRQLHQNHESEAIPLPVTGHGPASRAAPDRTDFEPLVQQKG
jgi:hypothetical protein